MPVRDDYEYAHISGAATSIVVGTACKLIRIIVNTGAAATTTFYNAPTSALSTSGSVGGILKSGVAEGDYEYGIKLAAGLTVVTLGATDITVVYANA